MERFATNSNFYSIDFLHFFAKRRKSAEKMTHRKKIAVTERPRSLNPRKVIAMAIRPVIVHFTTCARARNMTWRVNFVRNNDAQKQLARTSLSGVGIGRKF